METIDIGLDPKHVQQSLMDMSEAFHDFQDDIEKSMGRDAPEQIGRFEQAAENGANKIKGFFSKLKDQVKDDMKTAFNATGILEGSKFINEMSAGIKSTFEMEKAFSRLQVRLGLTAKEFSGLKQQMGRGIAGTGQKLEDIMPSVDTFASKGGVKNGGQLSSIAEMIGKVKATTGEDVGALSEDVVETLKSQGKEVSAKNVKELLDAIQGTRVAGAFASAGQASEEIKRLSAIKGTGLSSREMGGMAAQASISGDKGTAILESILNRSQQIGGKESMNGMFQSMAGTSLFKNGKLDTAAFGKADFKKMGGLSQEQAASLTGVEGATGSDLVRFFDAFKKGNQEFKKVVNGQDELGSQFSISTDNLASKFDQFKEKLKNSTRSIAEGLSDAGNALLHGDIAGAKNGLKTAGGAAVANKGVLAGGAVATIAAGFLLGGGLNGLMKKMPGVGGLAGGLIGGEAAKAAGAQPVYVVNASEISGGGGLGGGITDLLGKGGKASGLLGKAGAFLMNPVTMGVGAAAAGGYGGYKLSQYVHNNPETQLAKSLKAISDPLVNLLASIFQNTPQLAMANPETAGTRPLDQHMDAIAKAVQTGAEAANLKVKNDGPMTNPSALGGRGALK